MIDVFNVVNQEPTEQIFSLSIKFERKVIKKGRTVSIINNIMNLTKMKSESLLDTFVGSIYKLIENEVKIVNHIIKCL